MHILSKPAHVITSLSWFINTWFS